MRYVCLKATKRNIGGSIALILFGVTFPPMHFITNSILNVGSTLVTTYVIIILAAMLIYAGASNIYYMNKAKKFKTTEMKERTVMIKKDEEIVYMDDIDD